MSKEFGEKLKELRLELNLTQKQVADLLCTTKYTISGWELSKQEPSIDAILKLCDILDTTPNYLLGYDDDAITITRDNPNTPPKRKDIVS